MTEETLSPRPLSSTTTTLAPADAWRLIEIKEGIEIATHSLLSQKGNNCNNNNNNSIIIRLGRAADQVDVVLAHESCSRHHAEIRFVVVGSAVDHGGRPFLFDLNSTHGTKVNKQSIQQQRLLQQQLSSSSQEDNINKTSNNGGVPLYPGDVLQFGASTRLFVVEGPPEYEREIIDIPKPKPQRQNEQQLQRKRQPQQASLLSPPPRQATLEYVDDKDRQGKNDSDDDDDDESNQEDIPVATIPLDISEVPEKHRKAWERLTAKRYKISNILTEQERIQRKSDLTSGQEQQLHRIAQRLTTLQDELEEMEADLLDKLQASATSSAQRLRSQKKRKNDNDDDEADDVDDFYDRTKNSSQLEDTATSGETEETLTSKWKTLMSRHQQISASLAKSKDKFQQLQNDFHEIQQRDDHEQSFWIQNDLNLAQEQVQKHQSSLKQVEVSLNETERLLRIVNPKLVVNRQHGTIGREQHQAPPPPPPVVSPSPSHVNFSTMAPPPPRRLATANETVASPRIDASSTNSQQLSNSSTIDMSIMPPPPPPSPQMVSSPKVSEQKHATKRPRILGPTMPPPLQGTGNEPSSPKESIIEPISHLVSQPTSGGSHVNSSEAGKRRQRHGVVPQGTLTFLGESIVSTDRSIQPVAEPNRSVEKGGAHKKGGFSKNVATAGPSNLFDAKKDEWRPPQGQDGSGVTKLNKKFAGRY